MNSQKKKCVPRAGGRDTVGRPKMRWKEEPCLLKYKKGKGLPVPGREGP
jgi:hypothetical protein